MTAFFLVSLVTFAFFSEHGWATWDRLRASRATSFEIIAGKSLPRIAIAIAQLGVLLVAGVLVFGLHIRGNGFALAPLIVTFSVCLVLLGVGVTAVCRTAQQGRRSHTWAWCSSVPLAERSCRSTCCRRGLARSRR